MCRSLPVACKFSQLTNLAPGLKLAEGGWGESSVCCPRGYRKRVSGQDTWHKPHAMQLAPLPYQAILAWWLAVTVPPSAALWTTCRRGETQPGLALPFCFPLPSHPGGTFQAGQILAAKICNMLGRYTLYVHSNIFWFRVSCEHVSPKIRKAFYFVWNTLSYFFY